MSRAEELYVRSRLLDPKRMLTELHQNRDYDTMVQLYLQSHSRWVSDIRLTDGLLMRFSLLGRMATYLIKNPARLEQFLAEAVPRGQMMLTANGACSLIVDPEFMAMQSLRSDLLHVMRERVREFEGARSEPMYGLTGISPLLVRFQVCDLWCAYNAIAYLNLSDLTLQRCAGKGLMPATSV